MSNYEFKEYDFEKPSWLFILEDMLKSFLGGPLLYNPYIKSFGLKGDEKVLCLTVLPVRGVTIDDGRGKRFCRGRRCSW